MRCFGRTGLLLNMAAIAPLLAGCATISGAPNRVIPTKTIVGVVQKVYPVDVALKKFASSDDKDRGNLSTAQYRDVVVAVYLNAIDAEYHDFRVGLSSEARQVDLGLDLTAITATGIAAVAKKKVSRALAALAAISAGAKGAIDKDLYYERTLPALLAAMDAERLRVKTQIVQNIAKSAAQYPLAWAFADLSGYELSATLDRAIEQITTAASDNRKDAQHEYDKAVRACTAEAAATAEADRLSSYVNGLAYPAGGAVPSDAAMMKLRTTASLMGVPPDGDAPTLVDKITDNIVSTRCAKSDLDSMITKIQSITKDTF